MSERRSLSPAMTHQGKQQVEILKRHLLKNRIYSSSPVKTGRNPSLDDRNFAVQNETQVSPVSDHLSGDDPVDGGDVHTARPQRAQ